MPIPIVNKVKFNSSGGMIEVELNFTTLLLCTYTLELHENESNAQVWIPPKQGDNSNPEDDKYALPVPPSKNNGRSLWAFITIIDQTGSGGEYEVSMEIRQDTSTIGALNTGKKRVSRNFSQEFLIAQLYC